MRVGMRVMVMVMVMGRRRVRARARARVGVGRRERAMCGPSFSRRSSSSSWIISASLSVFSSCAAKQHGSQRQAEGVRRRVRLRVRLSVTRRVRVGVRVGAGLTCSVKEKVLPSP